MSDFFKASLVLTIIFGVFFFMQSSNAVAQEDDTEKEIELPDAGLTPESPFYFFERIVEAVQEFITFDPEAKARLHVRFAAERIAEIKAMLEEKGVEARGLEVAERRLEIHTQKVTEFIERKKEEGADVGIFAEEVADKLHEHRVAVRQIYEARQEELVTRRIELHDELVSAIEAGDTRAEVVLNEKIDKLEVVRERAQERKDAAINILESNKERLRDKLSDIKAQEDETRDRLEHDRIMKLDEVRRVRIQGDDDRVESVRAEFRRSRSGSTEDVDSAEEDSAKEVTPDPVTDIKQRIRQIIPKQLLPQVDTDAKTETDSTTKEDPSSKDEGPMDSETDKSPALDEETKVYDGSPPLLY